MFKMSYQQIFLNSLCVLAVFCTVHFQVEGSPLSRGFSERERDLFREMLCVVKGKTAEECITDSDVDFIVNAMVPASLNRVDIERELEPSRKDTAPNYLPVGLAKKRDAFYSDWKRRR